VITVKTKKKSAKVEAPSLERLGQCFEALDEAAQRSLLHFAEYLAAQEEHRAVRPQVERQLIPRPDDESVVQAIRRLSETYPMVDRSTVLNETSTLMAAHVMQGRPAVEVIDELEALFLKQFEKSQLG